MSTCVDCQDCFKALPIPVCTTDITICDDLGLTTMYQDTYVYIKDLANDRVYRFIATVTGGKLVIATSIVFSPESKYKLWVNANDENPNEQELFVIDNNELYCLEFEVFRMFDSDTVSITQFAAVLQLEERE